LVQGLGGKILMLEALSVVCHPRKTDGGRENLWCNSNTGLKKLEK